MRFRDKFHLFAVLRVAIAGMFPALMLAFVLAGAAVSPPAAASAVLSASPGMHAQAALGEALLARSPVPRAPQPSECVERHDSCGPGTIPAAHAEPLVLGLTRRASFVAPRGPEQVPVSDVAPPLATSLSILFRNFRK
jgi:hypothetical protein